MGDVFVHGGSLEVDLVSQLMELRVEGVLVLRGLEQEPSREHELQINCSFSRRDFVFARRKAGKIENRHFSFTYLLELCGKSLVLLGQGGDEQALFLVGLLCRVAVVIKLGLKRDNFVLMIVDFFVYVLTYSSC